MSSNRRHERRVELGALAEEDEAGTAAAGRRRRELELDHSLYRSVRLEAADAAEGCRLSTGVQWDQTEQDWRFMLNAGTGFGFEDPQGVLCASTVLLHYREDLAWIGMVLVAAPARRCGLATAMLQHAVRLACSRGVSTILLDATAGGREVYARLGFRELRRITRWRGCGETRRTPVIAEGVKEIQGACALGKVARWDRARFGADRTPLLRRFQRSRPDLALELMSPAGSREGICLAHDGRTATHVGPLVADFAEAALTLLQTSLGRVSGPVLIDVAQSDSRLERALHERGFVRERSFVRMVCGAGDEPGCPARAYASAGPEYG